MPAVLVSLCVAVMLGGCSDSPVAPESTAAAIPQHAPEGRRQTITGVTLAELIAIGIRPTGCDPWRDPDWCGTSGGAGECMTDLGGGTETAIMFDCPDCGDGGTATSPGGGGGTGTGGGGSNTNTEQPAPTDTCHTGDELLDDPNVDRGFEDLWNASNASDVLPRRVEQFGWLVKTATGYRVVPAASGNFCGINISRLPLPAEGADAIIAFIHTHP
jgi:hypothetical protein